MKATLTINGKDIIVSDSKRTLFDYAEKLGERVSNSCGKQGKCRECLVEIEDGMDLLSEPIKEEGHLDNDFRLSCCTRVVAEQGHVSCHTLRRGKMRVEEGGMGCDISELLKEIDPAVTHLCGKVYIEGEEVAGYDGPIHGLAIDLGTTTVVVRLFDLKSGELISSASFENPQRFGGSNVMARIQYDIENKGRELQRVLLGYLNHSIEDFPVDKDSIFEVVIAANTTMRDLFFGLDVSGIGQKPYQSVVEKDFIEGRVENTAYSCSAKKLHLSVNEKARVYGMPLISGHVGADASACMLAVALLKEDRLVAIMDIGTNTELILGNHKKIFAASCPAGPAFEGGAIRKGMPGLDGAVERVSIADDGSINLKVIGNGEPQGICGSGMIDLLGELLRTGKINPIGRYENGEEDFVLNEKNDISLHERDINEIIQAKAANSAGLQIIAQEYGISFDDVDVFYLAGGFGRHIDPEHAKSIGLIPDLPNQKIVQSGNAAIEGVSIALLSLSHRKQLEDIVKTVRHVELEAHPNFFNYFVDGCKFESIT